jgi:hypothetical protein
VLGRDILPTDKDLKLVLSHETTPEVLGITERFFLALSKVPCYKERVQALHIKQHAEVSFESLNKRTSRLASAYAEVTHSDKFRRVLEVVLAVGNFMNGTGFRGGAYGFNLSLLTKLRDTRGERGVSLLEYIVHFLSAKYPETLQLAEDWPSLADAVRRKG